MAQSDPKSASIIGIRWMLTVFFLAVLFVIIVLHLDAVTMVLLGVLAASSMAALLHPVARRIPGPRGIGAAASVFAVLGLIVGLGWIIWLGIRQPLIAQIQRWPDMRDRLDSYLARQSERFGLEPITTESLLDQAARFFGGGMAEGAGELLGRAGELLTTGLIWLAFLLFGTLYLLAEKPRNLRDPIRLLLPGPYRERFTAAIDELEPKLRWWVVGTLISMTVVGTLAGTGFWLIGLEFWLALAILAAAGEIVPIIGPSVAFLTAFLFAAAQGGNAALGVIVVWGVTQVVESNLIIPLVMRQVVKLPPVVTVFTVVFWAKALGPPGLLLAVPINLTIWTIVRHFIYGPRERRQADHRDTS
jgi:predicted PurR-regulated permease PerM